jgi:hypothetical protein
MYDDICRLMRKLGITNHGDGDEYLALLEAELVLAGMWLPLTENEIGLVNRRSTWLREEISRIQGQPGGQA